MADTPRPPLRRKTTGIIRQRHDGVERTAQQPGVSQGHDGHFDSHPHPLTEPPQRPLRRQRRSIVASPQIDDGQVSSPPPSQDMSSQQNLSRERRGIDSDPQIDDEPLDPPPPSQVLSAQQLRERAQQRLEDERRRIRQAEGVNQQYTTRQSTPAGPDPIERADRIIVHGLSGGQGNLESQSVAKVRPNKQRIGKAFCKLWSKPRRQPPKRGDRLRSETIPERAKHPPGVKDYQPTGLSFIDEVTERRMSGGSAMYVALAACALMIWVVPIAISTSPAGALFETRFNNITVGIALSGVCSAPDGGTSNCTMRFDIANFPYFDTGLDIYGAEASAQIQMATSDFMSVARAVPVVYVAALTLLILNMIYATLWCCRYPISKFLEKFIAQPGSKGKDKSSYVRRQLSYFTWMFATIAAIVSIVTALVLAQGVASLPATGTEENQYITSRTPPTFIALLTASIVCIFLASLMPASFRGPVVEIDQVDEKPSEPYPPQNHRLKFIIAVVLVLTAIASWAWTLGKAPAITIQVFTGSNVTGAASAGSMSGSSSHATIQLSLFSYQVKDTNGQIHVYYDGKFPFLGKNPIPGTNIGPDQMAQISSRIRSDDWSSSGRNMFVATAVAIVILCILHLLAALAVVPQLLAAFVHWKENIPIHDEKKRLCKKPCTKLAWWQPSTATVLIFSLVTFFMAAVSLATSIHAWSLICRSLNSSQDTSTLDIRAQIAFDGVVWSTAALVLLAGVSGIWLAMFIADGEWRASVSGTRKLNFWLYGLAGFLLLVALALYFAQVSNAFKTTQMIHFTVQSNDGTVYAANNKTQLNGFDLYWGQACPVNFYGGPYGPCSSDGHFPWVDAETTSAQMLRYLNLADGVTQRIRDEITKGSRPVLYKVYHSLTLVMPIMVGILLISLLAVAVIRAICRRSRKNSSSEASRDMPTRCLTAGGVRLRRTSRDTCHVPGAETCCLLTCCTVPGLVAVVQWTLAFIASLTAIAAFKTRDTLRAALTSQNADFGGDGQVVVDSRIVFAILAGTSFACVVCSALASTAACIRSDALASLKDAMLDQEVAKPARRPVPDAEQEIPPQPYASHTATLGAGGRPRQQSFSPYLSTSDRPAPSLVPEAEGSPRSLTSPSHSATGTVASSVQRTRPSPDRGPVLKPELAAGGTLRRETTSSTVESDGQYIRSSPGRELTVVHDRKVPQDASSSIEDSHFYRLDPYAESDVASLAEVSDVSDSPNDGREEDANVRRQRASSLYSYENGRHHISVAQAILIESQRPTVVGDDDDSPQSVAECSPQQSMAEAAKHLERLRHG